jgi:hypothetical protein
MQSSTPRTGRASFSFARGRAAPSCGTLLLVCRLQHVHPYDQAILEPIPVANARIGDQLTGARVVDHLMDIDRDAPVRLLGEALGLDLALDGRELSIPVVADRRSADHPTAFPCVRPIDLGVHQLDRGLDVSCIERAVGGPQHLLGLRHAANLTGRRRGGGAAASRDKEQRLPAMGFVWPGPRWLGQEAAADAAHLTRNE